MKKRLLLSLLIPLTLTSCAGKNDVSFETLFSRVMQIQNQHLHPLYKVVGSIDIAGKILTISEKDGGFYNMPNGVSYVANARYNDGFANAAADSMMMKGATDYSEDEILIFGMASRSYWLRMPMYINRDNFYALRADGTLNESCAFANLQNLIVAWHDSKGSINASNNKPYFELLDNGGFVIGGRSVRTQVCIDNYPYYMNYDEHPELDIDYVKGRHETPEWDPTFPLPCYSFNGEGYIDGRFDIRFEYSPLGWLVSESLQTADYDYNKISEGQLALFSSYSYKFS